MPVLVCGYSEGAGGYEVWTQERAPLPKGYVAYESELTTQMLCIENQRRVRFDTPEEKAAMCPWRKREEATSTLPIRPSPGATASHGVRVSALVRRGPAARRLTLTAVNELLGIR